MKNLFCLFFIVCTSFTLYSQPKNDAAVALALLAAPAELKDGASVCAVSPKGDLVIIRSGKNDLVCLADDPAQPGLNVSCYQKDLEPFMARGRKLKLEGKNHTEIFDIREKEVKDGKLKMPKNPSALYVYTSQDGQFNADTGEVKKGYLRYVVYIPYATAESTGLPLAPSSPGMPWIMDPGTHRAHIMINPPQN